MLQVDGARSRLTSQVRTATVVGSGPNGLAAAIALARAGVKVRVYEAAETPGGGSRTAELTLPGFLHDVCSSVHPLAAGSPFFRSLPLAEHGLRWVQPEIALAHPFDDGSALTVRKSLFDTARGLGVDADAYVGLMRPLAEHWEQLSPGLLGPVQRVPPSPLRMARFGLDGVRSGIGLTRSRFRDERTRALFLGIAAHANVPLDRPFTAGIGLVLGGAAHAVGWPFAEGGSSSITNALVIYLESLGGEVVTGYRVSKLGELPEEGPVLFDLTPAQVVEIAGEELPRPYTEGLRRFRYGPGVFKVDYALSEPIPWRAQECRRAGTVHLGSSFEEIAMSEHQVGEGRTPEVPFTLVTQPTLFDGARAPDGGQIAWAYCHVPNGSMEDMTERIERQIERFAPGFRETVLARHVMGPRELEAYNQNYIGGDIASGAHDGLQFFFRPALRLSPYRTGNPRLYVCSASTPPGAGVHGMCGYHAARAVLH